MFRSAGLLSNRSVLLFALGLVVAAPASATVCIVPDNGGTASLPPHCTSGYTSPSDVHMIVNGLQPGDTITLDASHAAFQDSIHIPGGTLGGEVEVFYSTVRLNMRGTGSLAALNRVVVVPARCETHVAPRSIGAPVQSFDAVMHRLNGQITGDPDFSLLRITAGTGNGLPSPGHTTLTRQPGGDWAVDSFFDVTYRVDFVGAPGGALAGLSGSTTATIRMQTGTAAVPATSTWALVLLIALLLGAAAMGRFAMQRRRAGL